jgi:hypothetical protein
MAPAPQGTLLAKEQPVNQQAQSAESGKPLPQING